MKLTNHIPAMNPVRGFSLVALAACVLFQSSCNRSEMSTEADEADIDPVAIQIGERKIRLSQLQEEVDFLVTRNSPLVNDSEKFMESAVERLIALEKARELGLDQDIEIRRQWENLLIGRLNSQSVDAKLAEIQISDDEIAGFYKTNKKRFSRPAQIHLALLFLKVPKQADAAKCQEIKHRLEKAREIALTQAPDTRGFGAAAMEYSEEATSRFKGGDIGWVKQGEAQYRWPDAVIDAGFALDENNAISPVITVAEGVYLLKRLDSREAQVRSLEGRFRSSLENEILKAKRRDLSAEIKSSWEESSVVSVNDAAIKQLKFKSLSTAPLGKLSPLPLSN